MAGLYIHVPFCISKCRYCDFYSVASLSKRTDYLKALTKEIDLRSYELGDELVHTIYLGGGTPSLLDALEVSEVLETVRASFIIAPNAEVTMECNPGDYDDEKIGKLIASGVNRFSIGAQSFAEDALRFLGRRHSADKTVEMVRAIQAHGISNISLDLIYGIPGTDMDLLARDVDCLLSLSPTHISTYHLIYEEGTPLYDALKAGAFEEIAEERSLEMSHYISARLRAEGYEHYEISNYALPGKRARHNSSYWDEVPYLGFGPSAHSYRHPWRSVNPDSLDEYVYRLNVRGFLLREFEFLTPEMVYEEYLLTRLRVIDGIEIEEVRRRFGAERATLLATRLQSYVERGLMVRRRNGSIAFTEEGIDLSDAIIAELF